ncbi:MAG: solute carrier family 23 protein [Clostridia bacterium]
MKLIYDVGDRPKFGKLIVFSFQQLLAIITATIIVPVIVNGATGTNMLDSAAALVGAGFGTIVYLLFTKGRSPVFLGSSFAFIGPLIGACSFGYWGIILGACFAGLVYIIIAIVVKFAGSKWVNKVMPPAVIGPTVALIGLSLAKNAVGDISKASTIAGGSYNLVAILCGIVTFAVIVFCSVRGTKTMKLIPFIIGILGGYIVASLFSAIGYGANVEYLQIVDFSALKNNFAPVTVRSFFNLPNFTMAHNADGFTAQGVANIALLYIPVAFVVFAEHIADHKNISSIIERDLLVNPGLHRTLLGDGVGSIVGALFGGCPNTTYGESIGCVAITKNASVVSILGAAILAIVFAFISPIMAFIQTIPSCVMGGVCLSLYGFIAVSGLTMLQKVDLSESKNLFVVSSILIAGIGGLSLKFGGTVAQPIIEISSIATALVLGICVNAFVKTKKDKTGKSLPSGHIEAAANVADTEKQNEISNIANSEIAKNENLEIANNINVEIDADVASTVETKEN